MIRPTSNVICKLYENWCDRRYQKFISKEELSKINLAVVFRVRVSCNNYGYENDGNTQHRDWSRSFNKVIHIVMHKHHRVYVATSTDMRDTAVKLAASGKFVNIGNHDSCWRESVERPLSEAYFEAYEHCWSHMPEEHSRIPLAANINVAMVDVFEPLLFQFAAISTSRMVDTEASNNGYFDNLDSITLLKVPHLEFLDDNIEIE